MSRILPFDLSEIPRSGRPEAHPWAEWFDGRAHQLQEGEDYAADTPASFRTTVYSAARRYGVKVVTKIIDGELCVQRQAILDENLWRRMSSRSKPVNGKSQKSPVRARRKS